MTSDAIPAALAEDGYCVIPGFLTDAELAEMRCSTRRYPDQLKGAAPTAEYSIDWDGTDRIRQIYNAEMLSHEIPGIGVRDGREQGDDPRARHSEP